VARLFVAATPPDEVLALIEELPRPAEPGVRWTARPQWHVTLRFLGEADVAAARAALATLDAPSATAELGPAVSRLGRSVVCLPVAGLDELAAAVRSATASVGEPPDPRPFAGHITLARLRRRAACGVTGTRIRATFPVEEVELVRSTLTADGPEYEVEARRRLS
jgi:RNA 2',3'-cyclic 3'-phosphodiesterase